MSGPSGRRSRVPFASWDPAGSCWRTCLPSLPLENLPELSVTWPRSGTTRNGHAYGRQPSAPLTVANACSSSAVLPTPAARDGDRPSMTPTNTQQRIASGRQLGIGDAMALLPTPEAKLSESGPDYARADREASGGDDLTTALWRFLPSLPAAPAGTPNTTTTTEGSAPPAGTTPSAPTPTSDGQLLFPTPRASDGEKGGPNQRGSSGDPMLPAAVHALMPTPTATQYGTNRTPTPRGTVRPGLNRLWTGGPTDPPSTDGPTSSDDPPPYRLF